MNYSGKYVCLLLGAATKVVEAAIHNENIDVKQHFIVDTHEHITGDTITNIEKAAKVICAELLSHSVSTKKLLVLSGSLGIETHLERVALVTTPWYKREVSDFFGLRTSSGTTHKHQQIKLGKCLIDGDITSVNLHSEINRELSTSLYTAFAANGFKLICLEGVDTACLNMRVLLQSSYDENGKVVINIDRDKATAYWCAGDIPIEIKTWLLSAGEDIAYQIDNYLSRDLTIMQIRQPQIVITSTYPVDYTGICAHLCSSGFSIFDFLALVAADELFTAEYILPLSLLLKIYSKDTVNLVCAKKPRTDSSRLRQSVCVCVASVMLLLISLFSLGVNTQSYIDKKRAIQQSPNELLLQAKEVELADLTYKAQLLNTVSSSLTDLITFSGSSGGIYIASIDTWDMLPQIVVEIDDATIADTLLNAEPIAAEPDMRPQQAPVKKAIVIRGYSSDANLIVDFFDSMKLQGEYGDYVLNGIEKIPQLEAYAFEIEVTE